MYVELGMGDKEIDIVLDMDEAHLLLIKLQNTAVVDDFTASLRYALERGIKLKEAKVGKPTDVQQNNHKLK